MSDDRASKSAKLAAAVDYPIAYKQRKRPEKAKAPGLANAYDKHLPRKNSRIAIAISLLIK